MLIYLDANVYNDVERGSIPPGEVAAFRAARARGAIETRLGLPDVEEIFGVWGTDKTTAVRRLCIARDLAGFERVLKQPSDILEGAIKAYAEGGATPSPLLSPADHEQVAVSLHKIAAGSTEYDQAISDALAEVKSNKENFKAAMTEGRSNSLRDLATRYTPRELSALPFPDFFKRGAADWAAEFAERKGLADGCRQRGLDGLLDLLTVRLCVGVAMSLVHSQISVGRQPDLGDGYDLWHAILAATADVCVTNDKRFYDHLARVPDVDGFRVVRSLGEALALAG